MGKIERLAALVAKNLEALDRLVEAHGARGVVEDYVLLNAALHLLQTSIQAVIDAGMHLLAELGAEPPSRYTDVPRRLKELGVLAEKDAEGLRRVIGFRNVVVHGYEDLNIELVRRVLDDRLYRDLQKYMAAIYSYALERGIDP
ncbi:MAG: DUF86 domain-containing protein [Thermoproteaceae archaeon]|jgi:uncharacterized protein YutE (UPF0331/DUF86 family)|nr:DUF86 domain-containing protein [Thermoproteaceae archaeon]